ncbi:ABC transporter ATP-binding protein [Breznakiella homolactica]|uniref:ABC transporter ATP-binding protein n=1 Tax=Breznakiella homolactica TaxID=2798577 RepID=A0A7T7XNL2_9SPIR|nr:ABC transporter ATP-binding protein [Breznakiella homolactica]QQO09538.1 ABC transporter ATP-binding protein [Breznakiella homolactica]
MDQKDILVQVKDLEVYFYNNQRCNKAVRGVSFDICRKRTLGVVGESGCGKSVTASAIMRLLPQLARIEKGSITYNSEENGPIRVDRLEANGRIMRSLRGQEMAMIFQDPMTALNPVYSIGFQIGENLQYHTAMNKKERREKSVDLLRSMGIPAPEQRVREYPHQFSGGMRQRSMIAMAMACDPQLLIADEPTTALDVTIQAQIFELIEKLKETRETAIMLITHDMGVVTELADDVIVMYMGNIVERGTVEEVLRTPAHPYTQALLESIPILGKGKNQVLEPIKGSTPDPFNRPPGCQFAPRCDYCHERCSSMPEEVSLGGTHGVRCWKSGGKPV